MSSVISSYEYDIFISYRQKDNKGERLLANIRNEERFKKLMEEAKQKSEAFEV